MAWYNPWAEIRALKFKLLEADHTATKLKRQIEKLERELHVARCALAEIGKNDMRDAKGRFTKAKN